jgi:hypothetical protein
VAVHEKNSFERSGSCSLCTKLGTRVSHVPLSSSATMDPATCCAAFRVDVAHKLPIQRNGIDGITPPVGAAWAARLGARRHTASRWAGERRGKILLKQRIGGSPSLDCRRCDVSLHWRPDPRHEIALQHSQASLGLKRHGRGWEPKRDCDSPPASASRKVPPRPALKCNKQERREGMC